jgi:hypothetical protein
VTQGGQGPESTMRLAHSLVSYSMYREISSSPVNRHPDRRHWYQRGELHLESMNCRRFGKGQLPAESLPHSSEIFGLCGRGKRIEIGGTTVCFCTARTSTCGAWRASRGKFFGRTPIGKCSQ